MKNIIVNGTKLSRSELIAVGELLFLTDEEIYPTAFGNAKNMGMVFPYLASIKGNFFEAKNLFVRKVNDTIAGVLVGCRNAKWNCGTLKKVFTTCGLPVPLGSAHTEQHYFSYEADHETGDFILCISVAPKFRAQGIGKSLLMHYLSDKTEVTLECLQSNFKALSLYKTCGFVKISEYAGYSALGNYPVMVCRLLYRA